MFKFRKNKKGFTLTELIVVVAILGIIAAVAVPMAAGYIADSKTATDDANAKSIEGVLKRADAIGHDYGNTGATFALNNASSDTAGELQDTITAELGSVPEPEQGTAYRFWVNKLTGKTLCQTADPDGAGTDYIAVDAA